MANLDKIDIGYSELTEKVYLGEIKTVGEWKEKKDITSKFLQIMEQKFPINTVQNIAVNGKNKYRIFVVDMEKEVIINGKKIEINNKEIEND